MARILASVPVMVPLQKGAGSIEVFGLIEQLDLQTSDACEPCFSPLISHFNPSPCNAARTITASLASFVE